ncbi:MAG: hypothetical protein K2P87_06195, partial [Lachnospiraceae bacterium]|nr:hypothetical protein [Lachnospiraceae bacterium]
LHAAFCTKNDKVYDKISTYLIISRFPLHFYYYFYILTALVFLTEAHPSPDSAIYAVFFPKPEIVISQTFIKASPLCQRTKSILLPAHPTRLINTISLFGKVPSVHK